MQKWSSNGRDRSMKVLPQVKLVERYRDLSSGWNHCVVILGKSQTLSPSRLGNSEFSQHLNRMLGGGAICHQYGQAKHPREVSCSPYPYPKNLFSPLLKLSSQVNLPWLLFIPSWFYLPLLAIAMQSIFYKLITWYNVLKVKLCVKYIKQILSKKSTILFITYNLSPTNRWMTA